MQMSISSGGGLERLSTGPGSQYSTCPAYTWPVLGLPWALLPLETSLAGGIPMVDIKIDKLPSS